MRATAPTTQLEARAFQAPPLNSQPPCAATCGQKCARAPPSRVAPASCSCSAASFTSGRFFERLGLERREIGRIDRRRRRETIEHEDLAERFAHQLIELRAGNPFVRRRPNLLLASPGHVDVELQDVGVGDQSRVTPVAGQLAIRARGLGGRGGRLAGGRRDEHASIGVGHAGGQIVVDHRATGRRHVVADAGGGDVRPGGAVEQRLLDHHRRAKVVDGIRMIERVEREVGGRELALGQQRAEDEHGLIAALPRLGDVHLGPVAGPSLRDALRRLALRGRGAAGVGVLRAGAGDGLRQGQRGLGRRRRGQPERGHEEVDRRASYHLSDRDS